MKITRLLDAEDKATEEGFTSYRTRLRLLGGVKWHWNGDFDKDLSPVDAFIDYGRWLAQCECGGVEYVTPKDPIFFCFRCGNAATYGVARPVNFPSQAEIVEIEKALFARDVDEPDGIEPTQAAMRSKPINGLPRSWSKGSTAEMTWLATEYAKSRRQ